MHELALSWVFLHLKLHSAKRPFLRQTENQELIILACLPEILYRNIFGTQNILVSRNISISQLRAHRPFKTENIKVYLAVASCV